MVVEAADAAFGDEIVDFFAHIEAVIMLFECLLSFLCPAMSDGILSFSFEGVNIINQFIKLFSPNGD